MERNVVETPKGKRLASSKMERHKKTLVLLTMVAPAALWLLLLRYLPMGGIILAFKDYKINPRNPSLPGSSIHGIFQAKYWSGVPLPSLRNHLTQYKLYSQIMVR